MPSAAATDFIIGLAQTKAKIELRRPLPLAARREDPRV